MTSQICPFHSDEFSPGRKLPDGSVAHLCERTSGHPAIGTWAWLSAPEPPASDGLGGLAEELGLQLELPAVVRDLGPGWWEYGLVERAYAARHPQGWQQMVERWGHTAIAPRPYTASAYLGSTLGRLSRSGDLAFHDGPATGRWAYNSPASYWSSLPPGEWEQHTSWVSVLQDVGVKPRDDDDPCRLYVPGS